MPFAVEYKSNAKEGRDEEDDGEGMEMEPRGKGHHTTLHQLCQVNHSASGVIYHIHIHIQFLKSMNRPIIF